MSSEISRIEVMKKTETIKINGKDVKVVRHKYNDLEGLSGKN